MTTNIYIDPAKKKVLIETDRSIEESRIMADYFKEWLEDEEKTVLTVGNAKIHMITLGVEE